MPASKRRKKKPSNDTANSDFLIADARSRPLSFCVGVFLFCYFVIFIMQRTTKEDGVVDALYMANFSLLLAAIGMIINSVLFIGTALALASFVHASWTYDLLTWTFLDRFANGRAAYIEDLELGSMWWTTLHQFWFVPLCFVVLYCEYRGKPLPIISWVYATLLTALFSVLAKLHFSTQEDGDEFIPSFALGHELFEERSSLLHKYDGSPLLWFVFWRCLVESLLNCSGFAFVKAFSYIILEHEPSKVKEKVG